MLTFSEFKNLVNLSRREILGQIFAEHEDTIKVKNRERVIRNLGKIFDATLAISNKKGFHAMSLRDLSTASGLSMGALYSYFSSKDELLAMIQEQGRRVTKKVMEQLISADAPASENLKTAIVAHIYLSEAMQPWFYFSYMEAKNLDKNLQKEAILGELATEQVFSQILRDGAKDRVFKVLDPDLTAAVLKAMLQDWYLKRWKYLSRNVAAEAYARFIISWVEAFVMAHSNP